MLGPMTTLEQLVHEAERLVEQCIPIVPVRPSKEPYLRPHDNRPWIVEEPEDVAIVLTQLWQAHQGKVGIAQVLAPASWIVVVDVDRPDESAWAWLREQGISRELPMWACRTPKGGWHLHLRWPQEASQPARKVRVADLPIDLLARGQAISPPTQGYRWVANMHPENVPAACLAPVPQRLLEHWREQPREAKAQSGGNGQGWLDQVLSSTILEGQRNTTLTRVFGKLHRFLPLSEARALLHVINQRCCHPPLPEREVEQIVESISQRPGWEPLVLSGTTLNERRLLGLE